MDGWMDGWMEGRTDGRTDRQTQIIDISVTYLLYCATLVENLALSSSKFMKSGDRRLVIVHGSNVFLSMLIFIPVHKNKFGSYY